MTQFSSEALERVVEQRANLSTSPVMHDLATELLDGGIQSGVSVKLDRSQLETIDEIAALLGFPNDTNSSTDPEHPPLEVVKMATSTNSIRSFRSSMFPVVSEVGVRTGLELLQTLGWETYLRHYSGIHSEIIIGNSVEGSIDNDKPVIIFSALGVYTSAAKKRFRELYPALIPYDTDRNIYTWEESLELPPMALKRYIDANGPVEGIPLKFAEIAIGERNPQYNEIRTKSYFAIKEDKLVQKSS